MASVQRRENVQDNPHTNTCFSTLKTYGLALAIIAGLSTLLLGFGVLGVHQGWWSLGMFSHAALIHSMTIMPACYGIGLSFLAAGIIGLHINGRQNRPVRPVDRPDLPKTFLNSEQIYGPQAWEKAFGAKVVGKVPDPQINFASSNNGEEFIYLYIPKEIRINGEVIPPVLNNIDKFSQVNCDIDPAIKERFGNDLPSGWVLISKKVHYEKISAENYRKPHVLEAVLLNLMIKAIAGEYPYGTVLMNYAECLEKVDENPVCVGVLRGSELKVEVGGNILTGFAPVQML